MSTLTNTQKRIESVATHKLWWLAMAAGVTAFIGNLIIFFVAQNLFGLSLMIPQSPGSTTPAPLSLAPILVTSIIPAIAAAVLLAILGRFVKRPFRVFQVIAVIVLLLSFGGPLNLPIGGVEKVVLATMHVMTAVIIVVILSALARKQ